MAEAWITKTQEELGAVLPAPKLTDKLLSRPPFRFLHDIVTNFVKANQFPEGYFSENEMDSAKVASKEEKLAFITKAITVVEAALGRQTTAKPAKILAGAEAENTADFLQLLAKCAPLSAAQKAAAVRKALGGGAPAPEQQAPPAPPPPAPAAAAPEPAERPAPPPKVVSPPAEPEAPAPVAAAAPPAERKPKGGEVPAVQPLAPQPVERPGTATARKPPPVVRSNEMVEDRTQEPPAPVAGVIVEKKGRRDDDDEEAKEKDWMKVVEEQEAAQTRAAGTRTDEAQAQGYLGKQALEAKRAQEEAQRLAAESQRAAASEGLVLNVKQRGKDRQGGSMGESEMSKLREQLQMLTKASNPLGKFLEAIHEDMDTMSRELEMWKTEARTQAAAAQEAQRQTEESLHAINSQLQAIEGSIGDQLLKINIARAIILQNDKTIETMLRMVVNPETAKKK